MDKLIFHSSRQQCLITFSFDTILRRLMRFSTHVDFPREERERERERGRGETNEKNSLVPLSIIERRVFGWLNLPRVRQRRTVKKGIIIREKKDLPLSFIPSVEKQMGHGRRRKKKWPRKKIPRRLETRMEMRGTRGADRKKWQTITKHWCRI